MPDTTPNYQCQDTERVETPNVPREDLAWLDDLDSFLGIKSVTLPEPGYARPFDQRNEFSRSSVTPQHALASISIDEDTSSLRAGLEYGNNTLSANSLLFSSASEHDGRWPWTAPAPYGAAKILGTTDYIEINSSFLSSVTETTENTQRSELDSNSLSTSQAVRQLSNSNTPTSNGNVVTGDTFAVIGSVLMNGKFKCNHTQCEYKSFSRQAELKRHHATTHASQRPLHWCPILGCERSMARGVKSFSRKDKLKDHLHQMHGQALRADGSLSQVEL